jgi:DNA-binding Lrp family transcriptional regulator
VKLVDSGVIKRFTIELQEDSNNFAPLSQDDRPLNVSSAFLDIRLEESQDLTEFSILLKQIPEVSSVYRMCGEFTCRIYLACESPGSLNNVIENLEKEAFVQVIKCSGVSGPFPNFDNQSYPPENTEPADEIASSNGASNTSTPAELPIDLLQYEISALEKSVYMDPNEERKVVRMAVKLVEGSH